MTSKEWSFKKNLFTTFLAMKKWSFEICFNFLCSKNWLPYIFYKYMYIILIYSYKLRYIYIYIYIYIYSKTSRRAPIIQKRQAGQVGKNLFWRLNYYFRPIQYLHSYCVLNDLMLHVRGDIIVSVYPSVYSARAVGIKNELADSPQPVA